MTDEQLSEQFHRLELRLERLDTKVEQLEKRFSDSLAVVNTRLAGLQASLDTRASTWAVGLWGASLAMLIGAAVAFMKL
jgi:hypothetical protein